jgi:hypothetical protein
MSMMRTQFQRHLYPGLKMLIMNSYNEIPMQCNELFRKESSDKAFEEFQTAAGLGLFGVVPEGATPNQDRFFDGYHKRFNHVAYGLRLGFSWEAQKDLKTRLFAERARDMGRSARSTQETVNASLLNLAFSNTQLGPDGEPLCDAAHPNIRGGTQSNLLSPAGTVSVTTVRRMLTMGRRFYDDTGVRRVRLSWDKLVVPPEEEWAAKEVLMSAGRPDTANRADNVSRGVVTPFVYDYLEDDAFFWLMAKKSEHYLFIFEREAFGTTEYEEEENTMQWIRGYYRQSYGFAHWMGVIGSNPS